MINAALDGRLDDVATEQEPFFGLHVPLHCPDVPAHILNPRKTWDNRDEYDSQARRLAEMFRENFKQFAGQVTPEVLAAGPLAP
jgi:phosphoenolpyruvate carboxykinase (ATP)